jgi:hypothetical protein
MRKLIFKKRIKNWKKVVELSKDSNVIFNMIGINKLLNS